MATRAGIGHSAHPRARDAAREAAGHALAGSGGDADFLLVFAASGYDQHELLAALNEACPGARMAGCSGEGVIAGPISDERERSVGVLAVHSDHLRFDTVLVPDYARDPAAAGRAVGEWARRIAAPDALALMVFPDGLGGDCTRMLEALQERLPAGLPVVGGAAGDALQLERTWQYCGSQVASGAISAVLLQGRGAFAVELSHGCASIGSARRVTDAEGPWLRTIDGEPAWHVLKEYLDGDPQGLDGDGMSHLSFAEELADGGAGDSGSLVIRTPMGLDQASGALLIPGGGLAPGTPIRLVRRDPGLVRESARRCAALLANEHAGERPAFVLQFDCAGRGQQLFGSCVAEEIVHPLQRQLGASVPWIGFHTYGEIGPAGGRARYHNYTVSLCAVYDRP